MRGYNDCPHAGQSIHTDELDEQVAGLIKSLKLTASWEQDVRRLLKEEQGQSDPEAERKEIRSMLRLMRENYGQGLYEGEEYQYWQKINGLEEKLDLLPRAPELGIIRATMTLLDLKDSWQWATLEERKLLVHTMIQEAGCDVGTKRILWVRVNPNYEILFRLMDGLHPDTGRRYWVKDLGAEVDMDGRGEEMGQIAAGVKISVPMSHNVLISVGEIEQ